MKLGCFVGLTSVVWRWLHRFKGVAVGRIIVVRGCMAELTVAEGAGGDRYALRGWSRGVSLD